MSGLSLYEWMSLGFVEEIGLCVNTSSLFHRRIPSSLQEEREKSPETLAVMWATEIRVQLAIQTSSHVFVLATKARFIRALQVEASRHKWSVAEEGGGLYNTQSHTQSKTLSTLSSIESTSLMLRLWFHDPLSNCV